ncbi:hypothetical protein ABH926_005940 [Catenulispora sp. GP43]
MADGLHIASAGKQRAVLGVLAARANQTISMPALIDAL